MTIDERISKVVEMHMPDTFSSAFRRTGKNSQTIEDNLESVFEDLPTVQHSVFTDTFDEAAEYGVTSVSWVEPNGLLRLETFPWRD